MCKRNVQAGCTGYIYIAAKRMKSLVDFLFTAIWQAFQEHDGKNWETEEELLPSDHQAP